MTNLYIYILTYVSLILITKVYGQCCQDGSCVFKDSDNPGYKLDLSAFSCVTLNFTTNAYNYLYTPCGNRRHCNNGNASKAMATQSFNDIPSFCSKLAVWDKFATQPIYDEINNEWSLNYKNGEEKYCFGKDRIFKAIWKCNETVDDALVIDVIEPQLCEYAMLIESKYACPDAVYNKSYLSECDCVWSLVDEDEEVHTLNLTTINGEPLIYYNDYYDSYSYYTPCMNTEKCHNTNPEFNESMAFLFNLTTLECTWNLGIYDNLTLPTYSKVPPNPKFGTLWSFQYTNGPWCVPGSFTYDFNLLWICDPKAIEPTVVFSEGIAGCVYQMQINSSLACN